MGLDIEQMDAEPVAEPVEPVAPTEPAAQPSPPIDATAAAAPAAPVAPVPAPEAKHEVIPLARYLDDKKALQSRIAELEAEKAARAAPVEPAKPVEFMDDPKGYLDQRIQGVTDEAKATAAELQAFREQQQVNALLSEADSIQAEFSKQHPDYQAALDHVRATRLAQLRLMDSAAPEEALRAVIGREEVMGLVGAKQHGINPADLLYRYAQTLGYKPPVAAPPVTPITAVAAAPPAVVAADVSAARSLGAGGGGGDAAGDDEESELTSALKARFRR